MDPAAARASGSRRRVDVWCDEGAFTLDETRAILARGEGARASPVRGHVGQFGDLGAAELIGGARRAVSAITSSRSAMPAIAALARAGTVAVMLPGACVQLRLPVPPVEKLRARRRARWRSRPISIPGSSYCETLPIQMWLATTHFGMTVEEAWLGVTRHAARALRVEAGALVAGRARRSS